MTKKLLLVIGTRPEAVKMCPLIKELKKHLEFDVKILSTGQHKSMLNDVLSENGITADFNLDVMKIGQTLSYLTVKIISETERVLDELLPDFVLVHGDTTTAFSAAVASFYKKIPVIHIEAGLRTYDKYNPYPEEFNRSAIARISSYHFAPTKLCKRNLLSEGIDAESIFVVGNTVIDAVRDNLKNEYRHRDLPEGKFIILTAHRRENVGEGLENIFKAVNKISFEFPDFDIIYPIHKNEEIIKTAKRIFNVSGKVKIINPLSPSDFHNFLKRCTFVITDSGGVQEEASYLGKPVVMVRKTTERKELLSKGGVKKVGTECNDIFLFSKKLIENRNVYKKYSRKCTLLGKGDAAANIVKILLNIL